jgi:hypothetical protein
MSGQRDGIVTKAGTKNSGVESKLMTHETQIVTRLYQLGGVDYVEIYQEDLASGKKIPMVERPL